VGELRSRDEKLRRRLTPWHFFSHARGTGAVMASLTSPRPPGGGRAYDVNRRHTKEAAAQSIARFHC
jgi:hypothetical protein